MKKQSFIIRLLSVLIICGLFFAAAPIDQVQAASLCVNTDGSGGCFTTIQAAINAAATGDTINVAAGKYVEDVNINKTISLVGDGMSTTSIVGTTGLKTPLTFSADNITVSGFTLTHEYTAGELAAWNDASINNSGVTFGQNRTGNILENCVVTLNRNGVYLNTTQNNIIRNNTITNNRTGINLTNNVNGTQITGNTISENWTLGIVYYYQSGAATDFSTWTVSGNTFDGNWYSEVLVKNAGSSTGTLTLSGNTFTDSPVTYTNSADASLNEPGFAAQKPAALGGTATKPANELPTLRIYNSATASLSYPGKTLMVGVGQAYTTIQAAVNAATSGDIVFVQSGTYDEENILISKGIRLQGAGASTTFIAPSAVTNNSTINVSNPTGDVVIDGFTFTMQPKPSYGSAVAVTGTLIPLDSAIVTISNNIVNGSNDGNKNDYGFYGQGNNAELIITNNVINKTGSNSICMEQQHGSTTVSDNTIYISDTVYYNPYFSMTYGGTIVTTPQIVEGNTFYLDHSGDGWSEAITFVAAANGNSTWANDPTDVGGYTDIQIRDNMIYGGGERARGIGIFDNSWAEGQGTITGLEITGNSFIGESPTDPTTIGVYLYGDVEGALIQNNHIEGVLSGIQLLQGKMNSIYPSGTEIDKNQIVNTGTGLTWGGSVDLDASPNWWGSMAGPATGQITGLVTYSPWCTDATCTAFMPNENGEYELPEGVSSADIQNVLNNAPSGSTIIIPAGTHNYSGGFQVNNPHLTILLKDGAVIQNTSPCFTVNADYTRITTETIGGAKCVPTNGASGIVITDSRVDVRIEGLEIDGTGQSTVDGIHFDGAVTDVLIDDNFIHNLGANGINFTTTPANVEIKGNLIKDNGALGIASPIDLDVTYNSWGKVSGPAADTDVSAIITNNTPFTHVELSLVSSGTPWADHVLPGYSITYTVSADFEKVLGADFDLYYPAAWASNMIVTPVSGCFSPIPGESSVLDTSVDGVISYAGYSNNVVDQTSVPLYTITFTAPSTGGLFPINLDETSDAFVMNPGYGASNNVYASNLFDAELDVITDLPTLTATGLDATFAATYAQEFSLTLTNPTAGVSYDAPQLQFTLPAGTTLEYWNGASWTTLSGTLDLAALANDGVPQTLQFRAAFPAAGSQSVSITLIDTDFPLATLTTLSTTVTVNPNYTVAGTFSMQGRSVRSGIPVTLTMASALYGPFSGSTIDVISNNLSITDVAMASYTVTTSQPRYLNVTADLAKTIAVTGNSTMSALELKGGNATDDGASLNTIDVYDASAIGTDWGLGIAENGDVNFSGKVDIFDLAIVGGNFDLTSAVAYDSWSPLP